MEATRANWIRAAIQALRRGGVDAVRVEALARTLAVTKGSFYWHFRDRRDLLNALLELWEEETEWLIGEANGQPDPAGRLLSFFALVARTRTYPPDIAIFAWARTDRTVNRRAAATEAKRVGFIEKQIHDSGIQPAEARRRAEIGYLATLGWLERSSRIKNATDFGALTKFLFTFLLDGPAAGIARRRCAQ